MTAHYLIIGIFTLTGTISLLASLLNWDWFFTAQNSAFIVRRFSRPIARLLYGLIALTLLSTALLIGFNPPKG